MYIVSICHKIDSHARLSIDCALMRAFILRRAVTWLTSHNCNLALQLVQNGPSSLSLHIGNAAATFPRRCSNFKWPSPICSTSFSSNGRSSRCVVLNCKTPLKNQADLYYTHAHRSRRAARRVGSTSGAAIISIAYTADYIYICIDNSSSIDWVGRARSPS